MNKRTVSLIVLGVFVGAVIGGVLGELFGWMLPESVVKEFFLTPLFVTVFALEVSRHSRSHFSVTLSGLNVDSLFTLHLSDEILLQEVRFQNAQCLGLDHFHLVVVAPRRCEYF